MAQWFQTYFSADAQITALNTAITSNATDTTTLTGFETNYSGLASTVASTTATFVATPNSTNATAVINAYGELLNERGYSLVVSLAKPVLEAGIVSRTVAPLKAAMLDAAQKLDAAAQALGTNPTLTNAQLQKNINAVALQAWAFYNALMAGQAQGKPADLQPAIDFLVN
jgi:hypothetical protein